MNVADILTKYANDDRPSVMMETLKNLEALGYDSDEAMSLIVDVEKRVYYQKVADKWGLDAVPAKYQYMFA